MLSKIIRRCIYSVNSVKLNEKLVSLLDQSSVSGINFLVVAGLALFLSPVEYADFSVAYSWSFLIFSVLSPFFGAGMLVFGEHSNRAGVACLVALSLVVVLFVLVATLGATSYSMAILYGFGLVYSDLARKAMYSSSQVLQIFWPCIAIGVWGLACYAVTFILHLEWRAFLGGVCTGMLLQAIWLFFSLGKGGAQEPRKIIWAHFHYGKYVLPGVFFFWVYTNGFILIAESLSLSDKSIALVRLLFGLTGLQTIYYVAYENRAVPKFASSGLKEGLLREEERAWWWKVAASAVVSFLFVTAVYGGVYSAKYGDGLVVSLLFVFSQSMFGLSKPAICYIRAEKKPVLISLAQFVAAICGVFTLLLASMYQVGSSLAIAIFVSFSVFFFVTRFMFINYVGIKG